MGFPFILAAAGVGANMMSSWMQGRQAEYEGKVQKEIAYRNAILAEREAKLRLRKAKFDQLRQAEMAERVLGGMIARAGGSGFRLDVGAPMDILARQAKELELENYLIGYEASIEAASLRDKATMFRYQGQLAQTRGRVIRRGSYWSMGGQGAAGYATARDLYG